MAKPSFKASPQGINLAKAALQRAGLTQRALRAQVGCSRQPMTNFFKGSPVAQPLFRSICDQLKLDWQAIADLPAIPHGQASSPEADARKTLGADSLDIVYRVREQVRDYTLQRCNSLALLGSSYGRPIQAIAPRLKILNQGDRYALTPLSHPPSPDLLSGEIALSRYPYLHVFGAPGAGKSTFLQYLAQRCIQGELEPDRVPLWIALREIASELWHHSLFDCIAAVYERTCQVDPPILRQLFAQGRVLLLLDGEDEVVEALSKQLTLTNFPLFYGNRVVITCRTAARQRLHEAFVQAGLEPFDHDQIQAFLDQWFGSRYQQKTDFLAWLAPIQADRRTGYDLAGTPLLLTLLCMTFESSGSPPQGKLQIYAMAFESLLCEWNKAHITPEVFPFELHRYSDKLRLLKAIARASFGHENNQFEASPVFFSRAKLTEQDINGLTPSDFLNGIERLYGLIRQEGWKRYRFSHLSFHEYLVALSILDDLAVSSDPVQTFQALLDQHLFNRDWYEVLLFVLEGLPQSQVFSMLSQLANCLQASLCRRADIAQQQIREAHAIAQQLIELYQAHPQSPTAARFALNTNGSESTLVIRAFCCDYHYRFDLGRQIGNAIDLDYLFIHDLVLAHCFKCNLNVDAQESLKTGQHFTLSDALVKVWQTPTLHRAIQAAAGVTEVRCLFFRHVLENPESFRSEVGDRFRQFAQEAGVDNRALGTIPPQTRLAISALVGEISQPNQEKNPFLQSAHLRFPTVAYHDPTATETLQNYYQGCTLLCEALRTRGDVGAEQRQRLLEGLF